MAERTGFLALTGHNFGPLTESHGFLNPGSFPVPLGLFEDTEIAGARRPRVAVATKPAPSVALRAPEASEEEDEE
jgi:hypothetical protein